GDRVVGHWGRRRSDLPEQFPSFVTELKAQRHLLSVEQELFDQLKLRGRYPLTLSIVTTAAGDERVDARTVSTGRMSDVRFENSIALTCRPAVSLPPLEAVIL